MKKIERESVLCIWYNIPCPIRFEFQQRGIVSEIVKPKSETGSLFGEMLSSLKAVIPPDLQILPAYCNVCPIRKGKEENKVVRELDGEKRRNHKESCKEVEGSGEIR